MNDLKYKTNIASLRLCEKNNFTQRRQERKEVYWSVSELVKNRLDKARSV